MNFLHHRIRPADGEHGKEDAADSSQPQYRQLALQDEKTPDSKIIRRRLESLLWIATSLLILYYSQIIDVLFLDLDPRINRYFLGSSIAFIGAFMAIFFILQINIYLKRRLSGVNTDMRQWKTFYPRAIPMASACGVCAFVLTIVSLWPVYSWKTPFMVLSLMMGCLTVLSIL